MCGIAGRVNFNSSVISSSDLKKLSVAIKHRGPDDEGYYISPSKKLGFVNRRLAIIDLSKNGHMPMSYINRYVITYNGEIYNFQVEREKLQKAGYRFNSKSDTEVILALYDKYGTRCLNHLRGMFAFAIYDKKNNTLFMARDRIGKKPFKYYLDSKVFIFASELKAILTQKEISIRPDFLAIHHFLTFGYVPSPRTGFIGIKKLEPGHYIFLDVKKQKAVKRKYWEPDFGEKLNLSESEWCKEIMQTLDDSTRIRLISDVPIGAFLSGGVDSSAVVATMARLSKNPIKTFTIGFKEKRYNETEHAARIAKMYKTDHTVLTATPTSFEMLPNLVRHYEEPFADASAIVTYIVSSLARKFVTVILNGDGGDENFAGYDRHKKINRDAKVDSLRFFKYLSPEIKFLRHIFETKYLKRMENFATKSSLPLAWRYVGYNKYFDLRDKNHIYKQSFNNSHDFIKSESIAEDIFSKTDVDSRDKGLLFDLSYYLPDDLLAKVDIASMAVGLEARSPFLDHKMVELAAKIPYNLKVKSGETKYILKKALEKIVPKNNLYRQKKGFSVPLDKWFTKELNTYASKKLLSKQSKTSNFLKRDVIKSMLKNHTIQNDFGPQLWALLTLEVWLETFFPNFF